MALANVTTVVGNLTRDPELRFLDGSGKAIAKFGIAVSNRKRVQGTDEWEDDPDFFDVTVWEQLAENIAESLSKGDRVVVVGRLKQNTWETDEGDKRSKVEITAEEIGVSLRWATVPSITRNEKGSGTKDGGSKRSKAEAADEEPF